MDQLADRDDAFYARSTALFGLIDARARAAWADHMLAVLDGTAEFGDLDLGLDAATRRT